MTETSYWKSEHPEVAEYWAESERRAVAFNPELWIRIKASEYHLIKESRG